ncbi:MAG: hypothetical protein KDE53_06190 [Caldilineaceae bacterium]|nr:hypothetical protein [Caldilineaceae bacterium]
MSADVTYAASGVSVPLLFALKLDVDDFQREWSRCNLLANYAGEYIAYQYTQRERAENLISTITNEFLEAVIAVAPSGSWLSLRYQQIAGDLSIEAEHDVSANIRTVYVNFLNTLKHKENRQHYFELLVAEEPAATQFNQLGLMMLMHDFNVQFITEFSAEDGRLKIQLLTQIEALIA